MAAGDDQRQERKIGRRRGRRVAAQPDRVEMPLQVVHANEWNSKTERKGSAEARTHDECARKSGPTGSGHQVDVALRGACFTQGGVHYGRDRPYMLAACDLGNYPTIWSMECDLGGDNVG